MIWVLLVISTILMVVLYNRRRVEKYVYDYKCFLLTIPKEVRRRETFMKHHNPDIPIEVIYGPDTRSVKTARQFENHIDPDYFEKAIEMHYNPSVKRPDITYFNLGAIGAYLGHINIMKKCIDSDVKYALIFEDNVIVKRNKMYDE